MTLPGWPATRRGTALIAIIKDLLIYITVLAAIITLLSYLAADILYVVVDPRISYE